MDLVQLVKKTRSYRRFHQDRPVNKTILRSVVSLVRYTPSARNMQPLKYKIVNEPGLCARVFETLSWAGYLNGWKPEEGERPAAYVVMCNDSRLAETSLWDQGIAAQTIMLGAVEQSLGGCIVAAIHKPVLKKALSLPEHLEPVLVLALGYPKETVVVTEMENGGVKYYRDEKGTHYVPKRPLDELIIP